MGCGEKRVAEAVLKGRDVDKMGWEALEAWGKDSKERAEEEQDAEKEDD